MTGRLERRLARLGVSLSALVLVGVLTSCDLSAVVASGSVTTKQTAFPVGGVTVQVYSDTSETLVNETESDLFGNWRMQSSILPNGTYRVRIGDTWWPDTDSWATADSIEMSSGSPVELDTMFDETGAIQGTVVEHDGAAVADAFVAVRRSSDAAVVGITQADSSGQFRVPVITTATFQVQIIDQPADPRWIYVGGATPLDFDLSRHSGDVGTIDITTGLSQTALGTTTRVSVASDGTSGNSISAQSSISADGRFVAFVSWASNLVPGDTNDSGDVFVHDRHTGETTRVSVASDGTQGNSDSSYSDTPAISADGRFVAFASWASNLVPGDTNDSGDVFVHDRHTGETTRVSVASDGSESTHESESPAISADGRYVSFISWASNLVPGDTSYKDDVFVHDRHTGETTRVSVASDGTQANGDSREPHISADGRYVSFISWASNLVSGDTNDMGDVFVHDRQTGETTRVSIASDGTQSNSSSHQPAISADGRYVAFASWASNLASGDTNESWDVFVHDRQTGETTRVSVASDGTPGNAYSWMPQISANGRYITFESASSNLVPGDTNEIEDVFVYQLPHA